MELNLQSIPFPELLASFKKNPLSLLGQIPGVFLINKPTGITSHDVVYKMRRKLGLKRVGHGGTLDPMATGLLVIFAGNATRLFDAMQEFDKEYIAGFTLGFATDTQDVTGEKIAKVDDALLPVSIEKITASLEKFKGDILQVPPMYSALKVNGKKLCDLAREGKTVERKPRSVTTHKLELLEFDGVNGKIKMSVSKGFYVRTLIDDLGRELGTYATMSHLQRTRIGPFRLTDAENIE